MLPLLLFWARCLSRTEFRETSCKEVGLSLLSAAPIECLMGFWLLLTVGSWWRPTVGLLRRIGFYEPFGLLTAIAVVEEAYLAFRQRRRCAVAYVGANHFLYGLNYILRRPSSAGVGGMLQKKRSLIWTFSEHRLADVWVHFGVAILSPFRFDHWIALYCHLVKYSGHSLWPRFLTHRIALLNLSVADAVDVIAHTVSAIRILGLQTLVGAVVLAQGLRFILKIDLAAHHHLLK